MEAQHRIATALTRLGATDAQIDQALENCEAAQPESLAPEELYFGTLARFVDALGGRLRVAAVFGDEAISAAPEPQ